MQELKVYNSLKPGVLDTFQPLKEGTVSWYACGPTVYDFSHLGHARNYVATDIIRRILKDYFQYNVKFVMNITDIDDKIILKARRQRILELEKAKPHTEAQLSTLASEAFQQYAKNNLPELFKSSNESELTPSNYAERRDAAYGKVLAGGALVGDGKPGDDEAKMKMHINNLSAAAIAIQQGKVLGGADDILLPYLDSLYKDTFDVSDHSIFTDVTKYYEQLFMEDMDALNVLRPDVITRVTEYVPKIVDFVEKLVQKGFAYEAYGSVYFDIAAFEKAGNPYARLRPESRNDKSLQEEGEGSLSKNLGGKKGAGDFALWKKSKVGEPSWPSPWGEGRPGWHIECSVMASDVLGSKIDVHSGGIDLAFPHHDDELAQSEAYFCEHGQAPHEWIKYFLHMGHLSIAGSKMSKSLKNFQTIRDALSTTYTSRGMRIVFLMGKWNEGVEISPDMRTMAEGWESAINNFFTTAKSLLAEAKASGKTVTDGVSALSVDEKAKTELQERLEKAQEELRSALLDSFNTPRAMRTLYDLVRDANIHINAHPNDLDIRGLEEVARWITRMVGIFGLDSNAALPYDGIGWKSSKMDDSLSPKDIAAPYAQVFQDVKAEVINLALHSAALDTLLSADVDNEFKSIESTGSRDPEELAMPYLRAVSRVRDELRKLAPSSPAKKKILALSDKIRDQDLTNLGVYLDDRGEGQPSLIKFVPKEELMAQREEKLAKEREKAAQKEAARLAREKLEQEKAEKAKLPHTEMFKDERYSAWDEDGIPTKTKDGEDVPKSAAKKLRKDWERQKKLHEEWKQKEAGK
ncbi:tRNA synthetases class I (C) catalytic domain-containing protein [Xylogone sp. PMI_703]|nr:tRNA synthetases class I (C) catalytic domain-containing protein [Xylogone sp. PMI_703]